LQNDCHLFIEKPIALKLDHATEILNLAENKNKKIAVGHIFRYFPVIGLIAADLAEGFSEASLWEC